MRPMNSEPRNEKAEFIKWNSEEGKKALIKLLDEGLVETPTRVTFIQSERKTK